MEDVVQQQVMPSMNVGQAGCSTRRRGTGRVEFMGHPVDTEYVGKANETKWAVIESRRGASGRFGSHKVLREQPGPTPHATWSVSEDKDKSLCPGDYSLMIQSFVTSSVAQKLKQPEQANRTGHLPLKNWMHL